ncbi:integrase core domain-containing protein, partial [Brachybacterium paraconglomeratum]|uniref:integrase core domain-containing protein n=1 Tax=Brachybacterium paraconglomeratum TaxID=173362 RepID=UPI00248F9176
TNAPTPINSRSQRKQPPCPRTGGRPRVRTTVFHAGPFRTLADVEFATAGWVDWCNNRRLHSSLGMLTPIEFETLHHEALDREPEPAK